MHIIQNRHGVPWVVSFYLYFHIPSPPEMSTSLNQLGYGLHVNNTVPSKQSCQLFSVESAVGEGEGGDPAQTRREREPWHTVEIHVLKPFINRKYKKTCDNIVNYS